MSDMLAGGETAGAGKASGGTTKDAGAATRPHGRILIVDDSPVATAFTRRVLQLGGYRVETASNIWISAQVAAAPPDLILIDVNLGGSLGTVAVRALRHREFARKIRLILHSSLDQGELEKLAADCGADGAIVKTGDPEHLLREIRRCLAAAPGTRRAVEPS